jgi:hypothetical protein
MEPMVEIKEDLHTEAGMANMKAIVIKVMDKNQKAEATEIMTTQEDLEYMEIIITESPL